MAVLARTNAQLEPVAAALARAEVPCERLGGDHAPASDLEGPERRGTQFEPAADAVALATIHRAKGLEWQHVAVIGMAEGQLPHFTATSESELAEERRLAYVALSRAERTLLITWSRGRDDPRRASRAPSRFLEPIERVVRAQTRAESPLTGDDRTARIASIRQRLRESEPPVASPGGGSRQPS
jgi:DNA helicase-2/ATP-dependent DNA helicase PcrA